MKMITNMDDLKDWRESSLAYHKASGMGLEFHCSVFFIKARKYFDENGFPKQKYYKNGKPKPFTQKDALDQQKAIQKFIDDRR